LLRFEILIIPKSHLTTQIHLSRQNHNVNNFSVEILSTLLTEQTEKPSEKGFKIQRKAVARVFMM
jgi:hypothetical protein